eukprot:TRINITY_DN14110_c0_g1_i1.p1 TRINITY_DN14110_c0_g1~~TRINITY_DN14110_c0_g1_i1.p1  ORF type:complete len:115 (-),score=28.73 TRINITY_DN14110_c0_g1_i1:11-355(-)
MNIIGKGTRIYFPNIPVSIRPGCNKITSKGVVTFNVPVNQTKYEIAKYLQQIYQLDVIKVNTLIHPGKWKRDAKMKRKYREKAVKKAMVTFDNTAYLDAIKQQEEEKQLESTKQ